MSISSIASKTIGIVLQGKYIVKVFNKSTKLCFHLNTPAYKKSKTMPSAIPDRWLNYKPVGKRIEGTRFIAFKVPLRKHVVKEVKEDNRLDVDSLPQNIPNLGLIIDLTNTNRYYDPEIFLRAGIKYRKLMIPGHFTPPEQLVNKFKSYVLGFFNENKDNDKLVGVHCTHGVNRTGYLICHYMISELTFKPNDAIERFNAARGHQIERENYLRALTELTNCRKISIDDSKALVADSRVSDNNDRNSHERKYEHNCNSHERKYERREEDIIHRRIGEDNIHKSIHTSDRHYHTSGKEQSHREPSSRYYPYSRHHSQRSYHNERSLPNDLDGPSNPVHRQHFQPYEARNNSASHSHHAIDRYQHSSQQALRYPESNYSHRQHVPHLTPSTDNYGAYRRRQQESQSFRKDDRPNLRWNNPNLTSSSRAVPNYINDYRKNKDQNSKLKRIENKY